ncbi:MAG: hypothetical protein RL272_694 [Candidatus Parcubacteria bacterium]|jgi:ABC-2 type transport system permease protein
MNRFFQTVVTIWVRELIRYGRDKGRVFVTMFQPLMYLFIFGSGLRRTLAMGNFGVDFLQFMYPGTIAMSVMSVAFSSTISTVWDREFGFLKEILVAPVPRSGIALGKAAGATTIAVIQALILLLLAPVVGVRVHLATLPLLLVFVIMVALAISGIGLLFASLVKTIENFGVIMNVFVFPMFFLSGAFFPLTAVPGWMLALSKIDPLTYGVDAFRQILLAPQVPAASLAAITLHSVHVNALFLLGFSGVMLGSAVLAFNKRA